MSERAANWQREMERVIEGLERGENGVPRDPTLLLHSCCGPCSSSVIERLSRHFRITVFYYNPNIDERDEYEKRAAEQRRLLEEMETPLPVAFLAGVITSYSIHYTKLYESLQSFFPPPKFIPFPQGVSPIRFRGPAG